MVFDPLKDKLDMIHDMPAPRNSKEVKQFLGLAGYYRKFVPHFADLSQAISMTHLQGQSL